ncbi:MAG TPA: hypothetical protein VF512_17970, partial [Actinomycetota bacterium]
GLQAAGPFAGRAGGPRGKLDARLGAMPGRVGPGRSRRRRSGGFASDPLGGADLTPYRRRAAQLATLLERDRPLPTAPGAGTGDLGRRLGMVRVGVEALVADLESVDAVEEEVRPLRELAHALGSGGGPAVPGRAGLERLRERALAVLRAFAAPAPPAAPAPGQPRDSGFWRR